MIANVTNAQPQANLIDKQDEFDVTELTEELLAVVGGGEGIVVM